MDRPFDEPSEYPGSRKLSRKGLPIKSYQSEKAGGPYEDSSSLPRKEPAPFGKLQVAGILLIIVFIWALISAVTIAMFEIHLLALTEFEDDKRADVSGYVMDSDGESLVNVTVAVHGTQYFAKTNKDGFYTMEGIKEGNYEIEASAEGYGSVTKRVSLNANSPTLINFVLKEGGFDKTENIRFGSNLDELRHLNYATAIFIMLYASFALLGGIFAYFQRYYFVAMVGAICGIVSGVLSIGIIIAPILSIVALYYILKNKEEFIAWDTPIANRLLGMRKAQITPAGMSPEKPPAEKAFAPPFRPIASEAAKPADADEKTAPPSDVCLACGGLIKSESMAVVCHCGSSYHRFCADSVMSCKRCSSPLYETPPPL